LRNNWVKGTFEEIIKGSKDCEHLEAAMTKINRFQAVLKCAEAPDDLLAATARFYRDPTGEGRCSEWCHALVAYFFECLPETTYGDVAKLLAHYTSEHPKFCGKY
jgi:hypothetical protein